MHAEFDLRALRALVSVAEHGSLTRAATALEVAPSALSRRISGLEQALGGRLFHRTGRGATPTDLAQTLLPRMQAVLAGCDALRDEARGENLSPAGTVELGLVPAVARPLVGSLVARLQREYPRIRLRAVEAYSGQIEAWLSQGRIDIGFFNRYGRAQVRNADLYMDSQIVVVTARRTGAAPVMINFSDLAGLSLVLPPRPNSLTSTAVDLAARHKIALQVVLEANSPALVRDVVAHAGLATLLPLHLAEREYSGQEFAIMRLCKPSIQQRTWMALTTQRPATLAVRAVARVLSEMSPAASTN